jgi:outer membrane protein assembly factor BamB
MRLRLLRLAILLTVVATGCDWNQFRFDSDHRGNNPDNGISVSTAGSLALAWSAVPGGPPPLLHASPAVASGVVLLAADGQYLRAYDAAGNANCSGVPKVCTDLWSGTGAFGAGFSSPGVAGDLVYVGSNVGDVYAYDRATCHTTCDYTWLGQLNGAVNSSPSIAGGVVYVTSTAESAKLYAFDAAGSSANCDTTFHICQPLWTGAGPGGDSSPALANGIVYVGGDKLYAFDAAGNTNCSGNPKTCQPLWTAPTGTTGSSPMVANGTVFIGANDGELYAFDATGNTNCSGIPKTCQPVWTTSTGGAVYSSPAYAGGVVYVGSDDNKLYAFDANGNTNCTGSPKTCQPLWSATTGDDIKSSPAVANGVIFVGSNDHNVYAYDAHGQVNCTGAPKTCSPLWSAMTSGPVSSSPAVVKGFVYVASEAGDLYAFTPSG